MDRRIGGAGFEERREPLDGVADIVAESDKSVAVPWW
jgi:hypothetical protein